MSLTHLEKKQNSASCGNCAHFVAGGRCSLVQGRIESEDVCDLFQPGSVLPMVTEVDPAWTKHDANYRPMTIQEAIGNVNKLTPEFKSEPMASLVNSVIERYYFLLNQGIPPMESKRTVVAEFSSFLNVTDEWNPDPEVGGKSNPSGELTDKVIDTGYPPVLPLPVFAVTSPFDNDGFDHKNPEPPIVNAGGRDLEDLSQYKTTEPNIMITKSQPIPYENQNTKNYVTAPFEPPAEVPTVGTIGFNYDKSIPEWQYDIEDSQGGLKELIIERDKKTGQWVKAGTSKGEHNTDKSLAPILDHARADYLHGNKNKPDDPIEMPHMVVSTPELPDDPHMTVSELDLDDKLEEATTHRQQLDISLVDIPGDTQAEKKATKKSRLAILAPWLGLLAGATMTGVAGYVLAQDKMQLLAKFTYHGHESPEICQGFDGRTFDLLKKDNRPVPPSEGLGYTNTHPNCKCTWEFKRGIGDIANPLKKTEKKHINFVNKEINKASKKGELHKVAKDGQLSKKTYKTNFRKIQEAVEQIRQDFRWLGDDYLERIKTVNAPGRMFLIRASSEAITDHRQDGEPLRRWLKPDELHAMARTAVGMGMDINHHIENQTTSQVLDSEFDKERNEIQMIVHEEDPEVLQAINNNVITAVSINGGAPRSEKVECPDCENAGGCECFIVPEGVILGELDNVALTWVVTDPHGMMFKGRWIAPATPGVKVTAIEPL